MDKVEKSYNLGKLAHKARKLCVVLLDKEFCGLMYDTTPENRKSCISAWIRGWLDNLYGVVCDV